MTTTYFATVQMEEVFLDEPYNQQEMDEAMADLRHVKQPKRRIKQNVWGNWYGYEGSKRVEAFCDMPEFTAEDAAQAWLEGKPLVHSKQRSETGAIVLHRRTS